MSRSNVIVVNQAKILQKSCGASAELGVESRASQIYNG